MTTAATERQRGLVVWWKDFERWDVKFFQSRIQSSYPVVRLGSYIKEHSEREKISDFPETTFRILGVTNTGGIFHAYDSLGKEINQPYKRVDAGDLAYNPYRVNVGSIGIVPPELGGNYISPAYVVFATDSTRLLAEYLFLLLKTDWFNPMLRGATAGSVRQNLTFDLLGTLEIPLPPLSIQKVIVNHWRQVQSENGMANQQILTKEKEIAQYIYTALGVPKPIESGAQPRFFVLNWAEMERWSFNYLNRSRQGLLGFHKATYPIVPLSECMEDTTNGYCIKPVAGPTPHKMLKLNALTPAGLDLTKSKYIAIPENIARRFSLRKGDLLICRSVGSYEQVAKCALVEQDCPDTLFPDIIIRARLKSSVMPHFVREVMQTPLGRSHFLSNARTAVGMWKIGSEDIRNFPFPLPPLDVQQEIVQQVTQMRAEIARIREDADQKARESKAEIEAMILGTKTL